MIFNSRKTTLIILAITAMLSSRAMFAFIDDPEGPNLLIVTVLALILYVPTLIAYKHYPLTTHSDFKKLLLLIMLQIIIVSGIFFCLKFV